MTEHEGQTEHDAVDTEATTPAELAAREAVDSVESTEAGSVTTAVERAEGDDWQTPEEVADSQEGEADAHAGAREDEPETLAVPLAELRPALEAVLMVADQPLDQVTLASAVGYPVTEVASALNALAEEYAEQERGFDLRNVAGGWRYYTREEYAPVVEKFVLDGQQARLTQAALETLAVVAYKQPVSRARVSAVRGVNVDGVMRTLLARGLVEECGHDEETSAILYRTTSYFLERIGVTSIDELPELAPLLPEMSDLDEFDEHPAAPAEDPVGAGAGAASDGQPDQPDQADPAAQADQAAHPGQGGPEPTAPGGAVAEPWESR